MNIPVEKLELIERIIKLQDTEILQQIKEILIDPQTDWWEDISKAEKMAIEKGLAQAKNGEGIDYEEATKQILAQRKNKVCIKLYGKQAHSPSLCEAKKSLGLSSREAKKANVVVMLPRCKPTLTPLFFRATTHGILFI